MYAAVRQLNCTLQPFSKMLVGYFQCMHYCTACFKDDSNLHGYKRSKRKYLLATVIRVCRLTEHLFASSNSKYVHEVHRRTLV
jgi:hypothetical protein